MSNKTNIRRPIPTRRKEQTFNLNQSIKDMVIPHYNALKDPFLSGFFQHPHIQRHLKHTGALPKRRKFSIKSYREVLNQTDKPQTGDETYGRRQVKSEPKKQQAPMKLPNLSAQLEAGAFSKARKSRKGYKPSSP